MICFTLSCKHIEDWVAKTASSEKENLAILILTKEIKVEPTIKLNHNIYMSVPSRLPLG